MYHGCENKIITLQFKNTPKTLVLSMKSYWKFCVKHSAKPRPLQNIVLKVVHVWLYLFSSAISICLLISCKTSMSKIFKNDHTVLHLVIACVAHVESPTNKRLGCVSAGITVACNRCLVATYADPVESDSVSSSKDSAHPLCQHSASSCTEKYCYEQSKSAVFYR